MVIGATLLLALVAGGIGAFFHWLVLRLSGPAWLALWLGLTAALFVMATGPIRVG